MSSRKSGSVVSITGGSQAFTTLVPSRNSPSVQRPSRVANAALRRISASSDRRDEDEQPSRSARPSRARPSPSPAARWRRGPIASSEYFVICDHVPVTITSDVMSESRKPHDRSIA